MTVKIRMLFYFGCLALISAVFDWILSYPKSFFLQILPNTIFRLDSNMLIALAITFIASLVAWFSAVAFGCLLGMVAGAAILEPRNSLLHKIGQIINKFYEAVYVIPFVITVSFIFSAAMLLHLNHSVPRPIVALGVIALTGLALGGFHIHKSIYESVSQPKQESRYLVNSLYSCYESAGSLGHPTFYAFQKARRFSDCEIIQFSSALPIAFLLSLVAVMILEVVTPNYYENFYQQSGAAPSWLGGAGRQILSAQQSYQFQIIAGCIWAVLFFTWTVGAITNHFMRRRWLRHYGARR